MEIPLDLLGSVLNFAGGVVLTWDAFLKRHDVLVEEGAEALFKLLRGDETGPLLTDKDGIPLDDLRVKLRLARRSQQMAWIGFTLVTAGFLAEMAKSVLGPG